jgi:3-dehydroquinate dehydratase II
MKIMVMNGPNLNMLGRREPKYYGSMTLGDIEEMLRGLGRELGVDVDFYQSNIEGELVDALQKAGTDCDGVILNGGAYTHTSVAIRDAVAAIGIPVVEVHLSNPHTREDFRKTSLLSDVCAGTIAGFREESYSLGLLWFARRKGAGS